MRLHKVEVLSRERFGNHVRLRYVWDGPAPDPGRFVTVRTADPAASPTPFLPRPFFVHDHEGDVLSLLFEVRGAGTALLAQENTEVWSSGPLGRGFDLGGIDGGPVALLGGGVWVAPLTLLARRLASLGVPHDTYLEVPATAPQAYAGLLSETYPAATLVPTDGGPGSSRAILERLGARVPYRTIFASGTSEMLAEVDSECRGTVAAQLAVRERMACADGSCFGCAVPVADGGYARACVEGPVFAVEELARPWVEHSGEVASSR